MTNGNGGVAGGTRGKPIKCNGAVLPAASLSFFPLFLVVDPSVASIDGGAAMNKLKHAYS